MNRRWICAAALSTSVIASACTKTDVISARVDGGENDGGPANAGSTGDGSATGGVDEGGGEGGVESGSSGDGGEGGGGGGGYVGPDLPPEELCGPGGAAGAPHPRVLFVLDTSGSMARKVADPTTVCDFHSCETDDPNEYSRIYAARDAIGSVIATMREQADFSLMTFSATTPPLTVPPACPGGQRFAWETQYSVTNLAGPETRPFTNPAGGQLLLCDGANYPYPYLRWDDLGEAPSIVSNRQSGALPDSPLIDTGNHTSNLTRKVQWFSEFHGTRVHLDCDNADPNIAEQQRTLAERTVGDYGADTSARDQEVCNHDYYYYPYVDGFVGYSMMAGATEAFGLHANVPAEYNAALHVPFALDLSGTSIPEEQRGPASSAEASARILNLMQPQVHGGLDVKNRTFWDVVIGDVPDPAAMSMANTGAGHDSVASYLQFVAAQNTDNVCSPLIAVLITDGVPDRIGDPLYSRIAALRNELDVKTYVVSFQAEAPAVHEMACAAAGACGTSPCDTPCTTLPASDWDTCSEPLNPEQGCAWVASDRDAIERSITEIIGRVVDPTGP